MAKRKLNKVTGSLLIAQQQKLGRPVGADGPMDRVLRVRMTGKQLGLVSKLAAFRGYDGTSAMVRELIEADVRRMELGDLGWKKYLTGHRTKREGKWTKG